VPGAPIANDRPGAEREEKMMRARTALLGIGGAIALTIGGSTAYAAIAGGPVDASGVVHGCYTNAEVNGSHALVLQDAGTTCPKGTTAVSWNEQGSAGATGPQGPAGPTGTQGPAGPAGAAGATGATGEQGPAGPAGASSLDALIGTPCDVMGANPDIAGDLYLSRKRYRFGRHPVRPEQPPVRRDRERGVGRGTRSKWLLLHHHNHHQQ